MEPSFITDNKVVALAIASFSFLSALYVYRKSRLSTVLPPGPPQAPILGNLFQMPKERPWLKYAQWTEEYGESYLAMSWELILHSRLGDIVHVRVFNQHLFILSNYEDATKLMIEAKYSDRLQTVMLHDLYVSVTTSTMSLILFTTGWTSTGALDQRHTVQSGVMVVNSYMSSSTNMKSRNTPTNKRKALV